MPQRRPRLAAAAVVLLAAARAGGGAVGGGDDTATVRQRMLEAFCWPPSWAGSPPALAAGAAEARAHAAALLPNCTWPDVNYDDPQDRTIWATAVHSQRVQLMAAALSFAGSPAFNDAALFDATRCALGAWLRADWTNQNWWWTILEPPQTIAASVLMLAVLPPAAGRAPFPRAAEAAAALSITLRAAWWNASLGYIVTGANLAWMVQAQLLRGAWPSLPNASALDGGFARLWQEVKFVHWVPGCDIDGACNGTNQGVQADTSWHFHGPQLQTAQYGQDYLNDELAFMAVADGTRFALDAQRAQVLCAYVAGGFAWAAAGRGMDWSSAGRAVDRNTWSAVSQVSANGTTLRALAARCADPGERAVVLRFAAVADGASTAATVQGHRHFWTSDWTSFKRPGWHATWRGLSNRTEPNECGNSENLLGMYESLGILNVVAEGEGACVEGPNGTARARMGLRPRVRRRLPLARLERAERRDCARRPAPAALRRRRAVLLDGGAARDAPRLRRRRERRHLRRVGDGRGLPLAHGAQGRLLLRRGDRRAGRRHCRVERRDARAHGARLALSARRRGALGPRAGLRERHGAHLRGQQLGDGRQ